MAEFDTTHLLALLRQHTGLPAVQGWDDTNSLRLLTSTLHGYILPILKAEWQEHNLSNEATTWTVALVEGRREYALPARAVAASIRKAVLVGPEGARRPLRLFEVDQQEEWNTSRADIPEGYALRGGRLYLHPAPSAAAASGWSLRAQVVVRPAQLCLPSACDLVNEVLSSTSTTLTYGLQTHHLTTTNGPLVVDVVRGTPPFEAIAVGVTGTFSENGDAVTFNRSALPSEGLVGDASTGDWVCPVGYAPFAQVPVEMLEALAVRTALEQLASVGDTTVAQAKAATMQEQRKDATTLITPRTGEPRLQGNGMRKFRAPGYGGGWNGRW